MEKALPGELRATFNEAARHVVSRSRPSVPVRTGRLAASIKPLSTQQTGRVAYGTVNAVPYQGFIEFGGRVGRNRTVVRPYVPRGRYLFPAAEHEREAVVRTLEHELGMLIRRAGLG